MRTPAIFDLKWNELETRWLADSARDEMIEKYPEMSFLRDRENLMVGREAAGCCVCGAPADLFVPCYSAVIIDYLAGRELERMSRVRLYNCLVAGAPIRLLLLHCTPCLKTMKETIKRDGILLDSDLKPTEWHNILDKIDKLP